MVEPDNIISGLLIVRVGGSLETEKKRFRPNEKGFGQEPVRRYIS